MAKLPAFSSHVAAYASKKQELFEKVQGCEHLLCDVELRVSNGGEMTVIGSNSIFLRATSSVFDALWMSDATIRSVEIADCSAAAIGAINAVAFGCLELVEINERNIGELVYASEKYDVRLIADCCQQWLKDAIAGGDFKKALPALASIWEHSPHLAQRFATKSGFFKSTNATKVFECDAVTALPLPLFTDLLKSDALRISEENVWKQCVKWAKANCEIVDEKDDAKSEDSDTPPPVGDFLSAMLPLKELIRYPLLPVEYFMKEVSSSGLLTDCEVLSVCRVATGVCTDSRFDAKCRKFGNDVANACTFARATVDFSKQLPYVDYGIEELCIWATQKVALAGIGLFCSNGGCTASVVISKGNGSEALIEYEEVHNELMQRFTVGRNRTPEPFVFKEPFVMDARQRYCVQLFQDNVLGSKDVLTHGVDDCVSTVEQNGVTLHIEDSAAGPGNNTDKTRGAFPCFYLTLI